MPNRVYTCLVIAIFLMTLGMIGADYRHKQYEYGLLLEIQDKQTQIANYNNEQTKLQESLDDALKEIDTLKQQNAQLQQDIQETKKSTIKIPTEYNRGGQPLNVSKTVYAKATAYGASVLNGGVGSGKTFTGSVPQQGKTIAVDPEIIPIGSTVYLVCKDYPQINGFKIAEDVGGAIRGNKIDVYFDDLSINPHTAKKVIDDFGVKDVLIYVLTN